MKNQELIQNNPALLTMPAELLQFCLSEVKSASPYNSYTGGSFYTQQGKTWDFTPEDTIRVSDHWNFYSRGKMHCITDLPNEMLEGKWVTAKYNSQTGIYQVISADAKDFTALTKKEQRSKNKNFADDLITRSQKRMFRAIEIRTIAAAKKRAAKIKAKKLWVEVNINVWSGTGRKVRFAGTETIVAKLVYESKSGSSIVIEYTTSNGVIITKEIRKWNKLTELKRKPKTN